jgi:hypothetical protein
VSDGDLFISWGLTNIVGCDESRGTSQRRDGLVSQEREAGTYRQMSKPLWERGIILYEMGVIVPILYPADRSQTPLGQPQQPRHRLGQPRCRKNVHHVPAITLKVHAEEAPAVRGRGAESSGEEECPIIVGPAFSPPASFLRLASLACACF